MASDNTAPLVSVVIPTHNRAPLIVRAVESCLAQQGVGRIEVIVVDDCSDDDTAELVCGIDDDRVRYLRLDSNQGGAAARNAGIEQAAGRYLALLDSDDTWKPDKLQRQIARLEQSEAPDRTVIHTQVRVCRETGVEIQPRRGKGEGESIADYLFVGDGHMQTSSLLMSTALARRTGFDPALRKHQDYDFCLRLEQQDARFCLLAEPLVDWLHDERPDRITRRYGVEASEHFLATRRDLLGSAAASAFWVRMIFLGRLRQAPLQAMIRLLSTIVRGGLPLGWYWRWLRTGVGKRLRPIDAAEAAKGAGT